MATDSEKNSAIVLPVTVFGNDADGKPFCQFATAHNVTGSGALLEGVEQRLEPGEIFGLRYNEHQARARVVWMCESGVGPSMQVGLQLLPTEQCPWKSTLELAEEKRRRHGERRTRPRYDTAVMLDIEEPYSGVNFKARTSDMSSQGCYIRTIVTFPVGTLVNTVFAMGSRRLELKAAIRRSEPGVGMGMEFIGITSEQQSLLESHLKSLGCPKPAK